MRVALLFALPALIVPTKITDIEDSSPAKERAVAAGQLLGNIRTEVASDQMTPWGWLWGRLWGGSRNWAGTDFPIDVVYTWISQPSEADYREVVDDCGGHLAGGIQRMRNQGTFRTSLRMLGQNMPWVRKVFVVSPNGDAPTWLNRENPKITVVDQKGLFPDQNDLPIHNSQQVEVHLHRIPGLAEHFIYFNDDMFASSPLQPDFFFNGDGKPIFRTTKGNVLRTENWRNLSNPGFLLGEHMPYPLSISLVKEMQEIWPSSFARISSAHCRGDIPCEQGPGWLYQWFGVQSGSTEVSHKGRFAWLNDRNVPTASAWYQQQLDNRPDLLCINDDFEKKDKEKLKHQMKDLQAFLEKLSGGKPSEFELDVQGDEAVSLLVVPVPCGQDLCLQLSADSV